MKTIDRTAQLTKSIQLLAIITALTIISGCTPHPGAGMWMAVTENDEDITKLTVFFEPTVKIYVTGSREAAMQCGWWALDKKNIEMECVRLPETDTDVTEKYQLNVVEKNKAELFKLGKLVTTLIKNKK